MDGLQKRFIELRYDGERTLSGTLMRYGDTAVMPWGDKERFEPGAFGNVGKADVTLNVQHDRSRLIGRTGGGGVELRDSPTELSISAKLPDTREANDAIELVRGKILRGFSVEFLPDDARQEMEGGKRLHIITRAKLVGVGVVDRPAYPHSKVNPRSEPMDDKQLQEAVRTALAEDAEKRQEALIGVVRSTVKAELETAESEHQRKAEEMQQAAERRADLLVKFRSVLPKDYESKGKTAKDILVAAAGDEIADAANRSEDYLEAKLEGIIERREQVAGNLPGGKPARANDPAGAIFAPLDAYAIRSLEGGTQ